MVEGQEVGVWNSQSAVPSVCLLYMLYVFLIAQVALEIPLSSRRQCRASMVYLQGSTLSQSLVAVVAVTLLRHCDRDDRDLSVPSQYSINETDFQCYRWLYRSTSFSISLILKYYELVLMKQWLIL
jgi:hypothetical protein